MLRLYRLALLPLLPLVATAPAQGHRRPDPPARHKGHTPSPKAAGNAASQSQIHIRLPTLDGGPSLPPEFAPTQAVPSPLNATLAVSPQQFVAPPPAPLVSQVATTPLPAPAADSVPRAKIVPAVAEGGPAILLRTDRDVGLAAFRSGAELVVVLDAAIDFTPGDGLDPRIRRPQ